MSDVAQNVFLGVRISEDLKSVIDDDARKLNVSRADIVRWRLQSGTVPIMALNALMPSGNENRGR